MKTAAALVATAVFLFPIVLSAQDSKGAVRSEDNLPVTQAPSGGGPASAPPLARRLEREVDAHRNVVGGLRPAAPPGA